MPELSLPDLLRNFGNAAHGAKVLQTVAWPHEFRCFRGEADSVVSGGVRKVFQRVSCRRQVSLRGCSKSRHQGQERRVDKLQAGVDLSFAVLP